MIQEYEKFVSWIDGYITGMVIGGGPNEYTQALFERFKELREKLKAFENDFKDLGMVPPN